MTNVEELKPVYYLYGNEEFLAEQAIDRLREIFSQESVDASSAINTFDVSEDGVGEALDAAEIISFFTTKRLVIAREVNKLTQKQMERLFTYLGNPNPATVLVLVAHFPGHGEDRTPKAVKAIESSKLYKAVAKVGENLSLTIGSYYEQDKLKKWIRQSFEKRHKTIDSNAIQVLIDNTGEGLRDLDNAIERICLFVEAEHVRTDDIEQQILSTGERSVFDMVDAIANKRKDVSLYLLNQLMDQKEAPEKIFALILRQFRLLMAAKGGGKLEIPPFLAKKVQAQAKKFTEYELRLKFLAIRDSQVELHSTPYLETNDYRRFVLELLIDRLTLGENELARIAR